MDIPKPERGYRTTYGRLGVAVVEELDRFVASIVTPEGETLFRGERQTLLEEAQRDAITEAHSLLPSEPAAAAFWVPYGYSVEAIALAANGFDDALGRRRFLPVHEAERVIWTAPWLLL